MTKNKLWLLLKVQIHELFAGSREQDGSAANGKGRARRRRGARTGGGSLIFSTIVILAVVSFVMSMIGAGMHALGLDQLTLLFGMAGASVFTLITSIYQTNGLLFGYKDYEMTMAMPFPTSTIVACRLLILYTWNLVFCAGIMGPTGVVYAVFYGPPAVFWPIYIIALFLTPLIPSVIATVIGTIIALVASRFERKGIMSIVFTILFMTAYMLFVMNIDTVIDSMAVLGPQIEGALTRVWPPAQWFLDACCGYSMGALLLFAAVSIGIFWLFCVIVGKYFVRINGALSRTRTKADFRISAQRASAPRKALLHREFKRLFGSANYFMNTCIGFILAMVFSVLIACSGSGGVAGVLDIDEIMEEGFAFSVGSVLVSFLSLFILIAATTVVSVSIEGNTFWISKTIPVSTWDILRSKQNVNLVMAGSAALVMGVCLTITFPENILACILFFLLPLSYGLFMTMFGQIIGLKYADLQWTSEAKLLKQSKPVMITTLTGMGIGMATFFFSMFLGIAVPYVAAAIALLLAFLLYRRLSVRGVALYNALSYD